MRRMLQKFSILLVVCLMALPVVAHARGGLVRDAEIELLLRDYSNPLFRAAGKGRMSVIRKVIVG